MLHYKPQAIETYDADQMLAECTRVAPSIVCAQPTGLSRIWKRKERGLFAAQDIPGGAFIGEYKGNELTTQELFDNPYLEVDLARVLWLGVADPPFVQKNGELTSNFNRRGIEGTNDLQYANHQRHEYNMVVPKGSPLFFARRDITAGEELTWRYGDFDYK